MTSCSRDSRTAALETIRKKNNKKTKQGRTSLKLLQCQDCKIAWCHSVSVQFFHSVQEQLQSCVPLNRNLPQWLREPRATHEKQLENSSKDFWLSCSLSVSTYEQWWAITGNDVEITKWKKDVFSLLCSQMTVRELAEWFCSSLRNLVMCSLLQWRADLMAFLSVAVTPGLWAPWYLVQLEADVHWRSQILRWEETGTHLCTSDTKMLSLNHFQGLTWLCKVPVWACSVNSAAPKCDTSRSHSRWIRLHGRLHCGSLAQSNLNLCPIKVFGMRLYILRCQQVYSK